MFLLFRGRQVERDVVAVLICTGAEQRWTDACLAPVLERSDPNLVEHVLEVIPLQIRLARTVPKDGKCSELVVIELRTVVEVESNPQVVLTSWEGVVRSSTKEFEDDCRRERRNRPKFVIIMICHYQAYERDEWFGFGKQESERVGHVSLVASTCLVCYQHLESVEDTGGNCFACNSLVVRFG
jgi:hypothetical protein